MLEIRSRAAFCVKPQPPRLCRARGWMQSWDTTGGEVAVFIHCSLSRAQGVPLVFILCWGAPGGAVRSLLSGLRRYRDLGNRSGLRIEVGNEFRARQDACIASCGVCGDSALVA